MLARFNAEIAKPLVSLLVGAVTLGIAVNAGTDLIVQRIGREWTVVLALLVTGAIVVFARPLGSLARAIWELFQARVVEVEGRVRGHRGVIVLASPGPGITSAEGAIRYHLTTRTLAYCWLVTGGPSSEQSAARLVETLVREGMSMDQFHVVALSPMDSDNPEAVYRRINGVYTEAGNLGLGEDEIIGDYTGGTKSMTAGMILACAAPRRHLQFMKPRRYDADGRAEPGTESDPVAIDIRFELIPVAGWRR